MVSGGLVFEEAMEQGLSVVINFQCTYGIELVANEGNEFHFHIVGINALLRTIMRLIDDVTFRRQSGVLSKKRDL